jgi:outer membrane protein OmpA-like peptidoglycan-associated protein
MTQPRLASALAALTTLGAATAAHADNPRVNTEIFRPSAHRGDLIGAMLTDVSPHMAYSASLYFHFGKNPLVFLEATETEGTRRHAVIANQFAADLMGSIALFDRLSVGLAVPVFLANSGQATGAVSGVSLDPAVSSAALGDMRLSGKYAFLVRGEGADGVGLAASLDLSLPTGDGDSFVSDPFTVTPTVIADYRLGDLLLAANLGARLRANDTNVYDFVTVGNELVWRVAGAYTVLPGELDVLGEVHGASTDWGQANATAMEGVVAGRYTLDDLDLALTVGGGSGFARGLGNTKFRLFAGVAWAPEVILDADQDGLLDKVDSCVNDPEDKDGHEDADGCPEADNDADGLLDAADACPNDKEDADGFKDEDGCPELDNDEDGIEDRTDVCPLEAEDKDGFKDEDGCPELDNDEDRVLDADDKCPTEPETWNGQDDTDGCPDQTLARIEAGRIVITQKIFFDNGKATIKPESNPVLEAVQGVLASNPQVKRVSIEGHTDDVGNDAKNKKLSDERAQAVMAWLVEKGIDAQRLAAVGHGEEQPAVVGKTPEAREANRRVEFLIREE